jgi:UDP-N-acetyl-D-glucosamine dehydrogenase
MNKFEGFTKLKEKITSNKANITVIGLGYVGLPLAIAFAIKKFKIFGLDSDKKKIENINNVNNIISSVDKNVLKKIIKKKKLIASDDFGFIKKTDVIIICVPTPIYIKSKLPMMTYVREVINKLQKYSLKDKLIILECTTYPGTTEEYFLPIVKKQNLLLGKNVFLSYSSEREDPGNKDFSVIKNNITKLVSGQTDNCLLLSSILYSKIAKKIHKVSDIKTTEFTKLLENIYRSVNIGLINEMKAIAEKFNINIYEAIDAAKTKPFGYQPFYPGPGVGGHCIPVDPYFLTWKAKKYGIKTKFIELAGTINESRPASVVRDLFEHLKNKKDFSKLKCLILGMAYKKNSDDTRMSPSIEILKLLNNKIKKNIYVYDHCVKKDNLEYKNYKKISLNKITKKFLKNLNFILILTDHDGLNYNFFRKNSKLVFDTRNVYKNHIFKFKNVIEI